MWEDVGKQCIHVHCYATGDGVRGCRGAVAGRARERREENERDDEEECHGARRAVLERGSRVWRGWKGLNGRRKGVDSRTNKTLAASFLPVWPDTDPLYARASVLRSPPPLRDGPAPLPLVDAPRRTGLSLQYFSSSLINGTAESKDASLWLRMGLIVSDVKVLFYTVVGKRAKWILWVGSRLHAWREGCFTDWKRYDFSIFLFFPRK